MMYKLLSTSSSSWLALLFIAVALSTPANHSPLMAAEKPEQPSYITLLVDSQGESVPALKYSLLPPPEDLRPGNAAPIYLRSTYEQGESFRKEWGRAHEWLEKPLEEINVDDLRKYVLGFHGTFDYFDRAARRDSCDWNYPLGEVPAMTILLPDAAAMRNLARLVAIKARLEIVEGRYDDAIHTLQTGYAMGQHVAETPFLVCKLIGMAISNMMNRRVEELIRQKDAPNMYWALTKLPRPIFNLRNAIETEGRFLELTFPVFGNLDRPQSTKGLQQEFDRMVDIIRDEIGMSRFLGVQLRNARPALLAVSLAGYPKARRYLIEKRGMSEEDVERLPVAQVVFLYSRYVYNIIRDEQFKWYYVSYGPQAIDGFEKADKFIRQDARSMEIIPLAQAFLPAVRTAYEAQFRAQRSIEALRVVEAVRMHAAANRGVLPASLDDITVVPVPLDPLLQRPFTYQVQGDYALLTAAAPKNRDNNPIFRIQYRIELRKTNK